jgi:hypothetical protein
MTRSRTAESKDDAAMPLGDRGADIVASRWLPSQETRSRRRYTAEQALFRDPLRQSDTANIPDTDHDSLPRLPSKKRISHKSAPYASDRSTVVAGDALSDQRGRIRTWKDIARKKQTRDKQPTTEQQRLVMVMVFNEITPYPPEDWLSLIGGLINRFVVYCQCQPH